MFVLSEMIIVMLAIAIIIVLTDVRNGAFHV